MKLEQRTFGTPCTADSFLADRQSLGHMCPWLKKKSEKKYDYKAAGCQLKVSVQRKLSE